MLDKALAQNNTEFALALYAQVREKAGNLLFSPYSVSTALAMTAAGARGNTAVEMADALRFKIPPEQLHAAFARLTAVFNAINQKGAIQLKTANRLWPHAGYALRPEFVELVRLNYGALVTAVDYSNPEAIRQMINAWVAAQTADKIANLLPEGVLDSLTRLVLVNAIYFKGNWASQFDPALTSDEPFWTARDEQMQTGMMQQTDCFNYAERDNLQIIELPYEGADLSMLILLPQARDGLRQLEEKLTAAALQQWTENLHPTEMNLLLPRFKITCPLTLNGILQSMGMTAAFSEQAADFSGMTDAPKGLYVGAVIHQAFIEVNEEGSEAAAATAVLMFEKSMMTTPPVFCADHPFIFLIREKSSGSILFLGRMTRPE